MILISRFRYYNSTEKEFYLTLRQVLKYRPKNLGLFKLALTHKSASRRIYKKRSYNNERLEYLGDSVLSSVVSDLLYKHYPTQDEGFLTKMRSKIVSRESLNSLAAKMGFEKIVFQKLREENSKNYLGNAFEAVIGAIYLDGGFSRVKSYITKNVIEPYVDFKSYEKKIFDYKSQLIEWSQKNDMELVFEDLEKETEQQPLFVSNVKVFDKVLGSGIGGSKKEAQQEAAKQAFDMYIEA